MSAPELARAAGVDVGAVVFQGCWGAGGFAQDGVVACARGDPPHAVRPAAQPVAAAVFAAVVGGAQVAQVGDEGGSAVGPVLVVVDVADHGGFAAPRRPAGPVAGADERGLGGGGPVT